MERDQRRLRHDNAVRRLRDAPRSQILHGDFPGGQLPGEPELMAAHDLTRGAVREALALLRREGLVERTQGVGTYAVRASVLTRLSEMHGRVGAGSHFGETRPRILDRSVVPATPAVAARLSVPERTACLRYEYVGTIHDEPFAVATNYALYPEAERLLTADFLTHWYQLTASAGAEVAESEFVIGCVLADPSLAALLAVPEGTPLFLVEQLIRDGAGRAWDLAFFYVRTDHFWFVSQLSAGA